MKQRKFDNDYFEEAYNEGYQAAKDGKSEDDNPYPPSGHERETTFKDELNYHWYQGFWDYEV